jgi:beta-glucosidase/6-phospho-beta-glucosidase/beta-galactosidase
VDCADLFAYKPAAVRNFTDPQSSDPFLWGVATSGYQVEGGFNGKGEPINNWVEAERKGTVQRSGLSSDFWNQAEGDFQQCRELGVNSFRLGIEWSRVQPCRQWNSWESAITSPPPFDMEALDRYAEILAGCRREGLEPVVTLHHFVHPAWLGLDAWLEPYIITHFLVYVEKVVSYFIRVLPERFGVEPPRYWITVNEPNMLAFNHYAWRFFPAGKARGIGPASRCLAHLLMAHAKAYGVIHRLYRENGGRRPSVGFNNYSSDLYWGDQAWVDLFFVGRRGATRDQFLEELQVQEGEFQGAFLREELLSKSTIRYWIGEGIKFLHRSVGPQMLDEPAWEGLFQWIGDHEGPLLDFIPFDYYDPFVSHIIRWPHLGDFESRQRAWHEWVMESITSKWWDWRAIPEGMIFFARRLARHGLPLLIAENGMAYRFDSTDQSHRRRDGFRRKRFLRDHVRAVTQIRREGIPLLGYFYWSWCDNYEWGSFAPRFGLRGIDFGSPGRDRIVKNDFGENAGEIYRQAIQRSEAELHR